MAMIYTALEDLPPLLSGFTHLTCPEVEILQNGFLEMEPSEESVSKAKETFLELFQVVTTTSENDPRKVDFDSILSSLATPPPPSSSSSSSSVARTPSLNTLDAVKLLRSLVLLQVLTAVSLVFDSTQT
jgi:hypothetical protein